MKSPLWMLAVMLPLLTELAAASPAAEPEFEERDLEDRQGGRGNPCRIDHSYSYWKYPCDSSDRKGRANRGDQFSATCKYKNWYKTSKGWAHDFDKPPRCKGNWNNPCND